ncbi:hypothetical protein JTB14_036006 [Gonioctena quinquepunctata]|nr:hypothetical protein JTB14_036006 [Gonioctena quinquepunctata]
MIPRRSLSFNLGKKTESSKKTAKQILKQQETLNDPFAVSVSVSQRAAGFRIADGEIQYHPMSKLSRDNSFSVDLLHELEKSRLFKIQRFKIDNRKSKSTEYLETHFRNGETTDDERESKQQLHNRKSFSLSNLEERNRVS